MVQFQYHANGRPARPGQVTLSNEEASRAEALSEKKADIGSIYAFGKSNEWLTHLGKTYYITSHEVIQYTMAVALGVGADVRLSDNNFETMTASDLRSLLNAILSRYDTWTKAYAAHLKQLEDLPTNADIRGYNPNVNWPS
jgi:hypothetical protein